MALSGKERSDYIEYRVERSYKTLKEARDNAGLGNWNLAINRLYYASFYMAIALILSKGDTAKSHSGVFNIINKNYIATGLLDKKAGILYRKLFSMRQSGDYDDLFDWTEDDVIPLIEPVENLINILHRFIKA